jgi:Ca2+/Na+ antiporter
LNPLLISLAIVAVVSITAGISSRKAAARVSAVASAGPEAVSLRKTRLKRRLAILGLLVVALPLTLLVIEWNPYVWAVIATGMMAAVYLVLSLTELRKLSRREPADADANGADGQHLGSCRTRDET